MTNYLIKSFDDFNFDNLIFGKEITVNNNIKKIYIYYLEDKPKEISFNFPNIRTIYSYKNIKYNQIKIPIYPLWNETNIFLKFIKKIEKHIQQKLKIDKTYSYCLEKKENISTIKINISESIKNKLCKLNLNSEIEGTISISYIWIKDDSWGISLNFNKFNCINKIDDIDFIDDIIKVNNNSDLVIYKTEPVIYKTEPVVYKTEPVIYKSLIKHQINISPHLLQDTLKKLKKI